MLKRRRSGVLCHLTSLPRRQGEGAIGAEAERFLDWMAEAGLGFWQVLPLNPPDAVGSPYRSRSVFAIDPGLADGQGLDAVTLADLEALGRAEPGAVEAFRERHAYWLEDFALFSVARRRLERPWWRWPAALRDRHPRALARLRNEEQRAIAEIIARQLLAFRSWQRLRGEAGRRDITVIGDMPLYPAADSAEVWAHPELFRLDERGRPLHVAGVPPDYFSATGQRWGNPVFDWERLEETGFAWWIERLRTQLELYDVVRIDHFRGLESYWEIPARARTAEKGRWRKAPGHALLSRLRACFHPLPLIAEDLGTITAEVDELRKRFDLPGMRVLQFAFSGEPDNPHLPEHHVPDCVAYTGTHDNDTTLGWYRKLDRETRARVDARLAPQAEMPWSLIEMLFHSRANSVVVPMQDFLALDSDARMNVPGRSAGNWGWRFSWSGIPPALAGRIRALGRESERV